MQKTVEEAAWSSPSEIDNRIFLWTYNNSAEDHELECFFSGLPGFRSSKLIEDPLPSVTEERKMGFFETLIGLLDRTLSSGLLPKSDQNRRAVTVICAKRLL